MMGKDHISISLAWGFLLASPILIQYPICFMAFLIGIIFGSVYPDIDVPRNNSGSVSSNDYGENSGPLAKLLYWISRPVMELTGFIVSKGNGAKKETYLKHRMLMHSILGIVLSLGIILAPLNLILYFVGYWNLAFFIGTFGVLVGAFMHLLEDSCTKSGIMYFFPFSKKALRGNILVRTGSTKAGKLFSTIFAVPACAYLAYDLVLKNMQGFSQLSFIDGLGIWEKLAMMVIISMIAWFVCFGLSQSRDWDRLN